VNGIILAMSYFEGSSFLYALTTLPKVPYPITSSEEMRKGVPVSDLTLIVFFMEVINNIIKC
jgi:hypothetical protein